jgi:Predicted Rossmann fold nucleotide-binding protein
VLVDRAFWSPLLDWVRERALPLGMVSPEDLELLTVTDEPEEALRVVLDSYGTLSPAGDEPHIPRAT